MVLATFLNAITEILHILINTYMWIVIISALITFVRPDPYNQIVQILYRLTEPVFMQVRRALPTIFNGIDFAPLIVIIFLKFIDLFLIGILRNYVVGF
ncbi:MAG: YggT family protein [Helicobacteraceae bacterium]|nr:YggT family protein [Helicobacteraceae bacterium]